MRCLAEVIAVTEPVATVRDVGELELDFMLSFIGPVVEVHPVQDVTNPELVEMAVRPAHRLLEDHVELKRRDRGGSASSSAIRRFAAASSAFRHCSGQRPVPVDPSGRRHT
jgi:hypothetical protein